VENLGASLLGSLKFKRIRAPLFVCGSAFVAGIANAEIIVDGSVGVNTTPTSVAATGGNYAITADLGLQTGGNLLHSFDTFNIGSGETAMFTGPSSVNNIISRVTGGDPSSINGTIASDIAGANLWLLNPDGIVFGEGATLNITGSFHAATADYLQLRDGVEIPSTTASPILTNAAPHAFGFVNESTISNSSLTLQNANLAVPENEFLGLVGSDVNVSASVLSAPGGQISIVSINEAGEVDYSDQGYQAHYSEGSSSHGDDAGFSGSLTLSNSALKVDGSREGNLQIEGGDININTNNTDVVPSVSNLSTSFYEEVDLLDKPCELAEFYGKGSLAFTVNEEDEETQFGVEVKKIRGGALGLIPQKDCL